MFFSLSSSRIIVDNFKKTELISQNQELNPKKIKKILDILENLKNLHKKGNRSS